MFSKIVTVVFFFFLLFHVAKGNPHGKKVKKFLVINGVPATPEAFEKVREEFKDNNNLRIGVGFIISYLRDTREKTEETLRQYLRLSQQFDMPLVIQLDGEQWWQGRPDLWNWWDETKPGYNPENKKNVEWTDWTPDSAVKIGWRNWGKQIRVLPMPNLMSPVYREACHIEMARLVRIVVQWYKQLPARRKDLLIALKVGWESAIGVNNYYYPGGNSYKEQPVENDPKGPLKPDVLPGRGVAAIGYAAVSTLGLAKSGALNPADIAEVIKVHLTDLSKLAHDMGVPRKKLFTHCGGWSQGEQLYLSALNKYSCPGWSFYKYASNPAMDSTAMKAVRASNAPYWGIVEWALLGKKTREQWLLALKNSLAVPGVRYMCIYNWKGLQKNEPGKAAIKEYLSTQ
jgi:hypothetical protein